MIYFYSYLIPRQRLPKKVKNWSMLVGTIFFCPLDSTQFLPSRGPLMAGDIIQYLVQKVLPSKASLFLENVVSIWVWPWQTLPYSHHKAPSAHDHGNPYQGHQLHLVLLPSWLLAIWNELCSEAVIRHRNTRVQEGKLQAQKLSCCQARLWTFCQQDNVTIGPFEWAWLRNAHH